MKTVKVKKLLIEQLRKTPIIQIACEKTGVGRATYYRWRKQDPEFTRMTDDALSEGASLINDMAESQLISSIKDKNLGAIIFWLKSHHSAYATKMEVTAQIKNQDEKLTPDQEAIVNKALKIAAMIPIPEKLRKEGKNE